MNNSNSEQVIEDDTVSADIDDIEKLRSILVHPERNEILRLHEQLDALQCRLTDPKYRAVDTSEILIEATELSHKRDDGYSAALKPIIVEQFQTSARESPEIMAEALFPILGPAIRKMIANMISPDKNKTKRTYKFEQLFLIEQESGLPICHAKSVAAETQDADMVSGMLSAIQSFVQDAFSTQEFDGLNTLQLGELSVWIEWGPDAVIAAVIRGVAPEHCRTALQCLLEDIHSDYAQQLKNYEGDASVFNPVKAEFVLFMDNHDSRLRNRVRTMPQGLRSRLTIIGVVLACLLVWLVYDQYDKLKWNRFVSKLDARPGIVITGSERNRQKYIVRGLKDPLARDIGALLSSSGLNKDRVAFEFEAYNSMLPEFSIKRIRSVLVPPDGVDLVLDGTVLRITGAESKSWINDTRRLARQFPEVSHVTFGLANQ